MNFLQDKQDRDGILWALEYWQRDPITACAIVGRQMNWMRLSQQQGDTYLRMTNDPVELFRMLECEVRRCGVSCTVNEPPNDIITCWFAEVDGQLVRKTFDLPQIRAILAELIRLPDEAKSDALKVLRGKKQ